MLTEVESRTLQPTRGESSRRARFMSALEVWRLIHWRSLLTQWKISLLVLTGVTLGIILFAGMVLMVWASSRPFSSQTALVAGAADHQVTPRVVRGFPEERFLDVESAGGVDAAVPIAAGLTNLASETASHGFLLIGTDCRIEAVLGDFDCATQSEQLQPGPTSDRPRLLISSRLAEVLDVGPGSLVGVSGGRLGDAMVAETIEGDIAFEDVNGGFWAVASVPGAQNLLRMGPFLSQILLSTSGGGADNVASIVEDVAFVESPSAEDSVFLQMTRRLLLVAALLVLIGSLLIAANTYTLAIDARQRLLAVVSVLGQPPRRFVVGLAAEGALIGAAAGLVATLPAWAVGNFLSNLWGAELLAGTGASIGVPAIIWWLPLLCVGIGVTSGLATTIPAARRFISTNHPGLVRGEIRTGTARQRHYWVALIGIALLGLGLATGWLWGRAHVPFAVGIAGVALVAGGFVLTVFAIAPAILAGVEWICAHGRAAALLTAADLAKDPLRWSTVVVVFATAMMLGVGFNSLRAMTVRSLDHHIGAVLEGVVYAHPRTPGQQETARFSDAAITELHDVAGVDSVSPQYLATVTMPDGPVNVIGTDPDRPRAHLEFPPDVDGADVWRGVASGEAIASIQLANQHGLKAGDTWTVPTVLGPRDVRIAAIADTGYSQDNGVGPWIIVSDDTAAGLWAAAPDQLIVDPQPGLSTADLAATIEQRVDIVRLSTLDETRTLEAAAGNGKRFLGPIEQVGWLMVVISAAAIAVFIVLALAERKRQRTVLRWIGYDRKMEHRNLLYEIGTLVLAGYLFGVAGAWAFGLFASLASPSLLASTVSWSIVPNALLLGAVAAVAIGAVGFAAGAWQARQLDRELQARAGAGSARPITSKSRW